ncbi:MAG: VWA domain-containing protein [Planctomycetes bacterium]|nr:VWA domain-containing protein [Planctomycetota bacterium]
MRPASIATLVRLAALAVAVVAAVAIRAQEAGQEKVQDDQRFRFESRVDLVNVAATVTDADGRFVGGLQKDEFVLYEDGKPQEVALFSNERIPVSLGIAIDTSGSMAGEKIDAARSALDRFLGQLLDPADEIFLYRFDDDVQLLQRWTTNRAELKRALGRITPRGGTTLYDTVAEAVPMAVTGHHRKKALVVISDGNDTASHTGVPELKQMIRETEVLVYAIGIDGQAQPTVVRRPPRLPIPIPRPPFPGRGGRFPFPPGRAPIPRPPPVGPGRAVVVTPPGERVNILALRELTDDSGGRTEVIRTAVDLNPATAGVADELTRQYYLGYQSPSAGDGRWHAIRVEVTREPNLRVRARTGFTASRRQ